MHKLVPGTRTRVLGDGSAGGGALQKVGPHALAGHVRLLRQGAGLDHHLSVHKGMCIYV